MVSPLEQFNVQVVYPIRVNLMGVDVDVSLTNNGISLILGVILVVMLMRLGLSKAYVTPGQQRYTTHMRFDYWHIMIEKVVWEFIYNIIMQQVGRKGIAYIPLIGALFYYILILNVQGLLPYSFTATSQIMVTFTLGFSVVCGVVIVGLYKQKLGFLRLFIPSNVPTILLPFLVVIEVVSYMIRPISLSLRLCANMMAGHTLLNIIGSFLIALLRYKIYLAIMTGLLIIAITILEVG
jgi:F-type H+-transporting ATPase subunit a